MEQLNKVLPVNQEESEAAAGARESEHLLLDKVHQKFGFYGGISLVFGGGFAFLFYKSWLGLNVLGFSVLILGLLYMTMKKLSVPVKKGTWVYATGVVLLGISTCVTASSILQLLNILGILFLLDLLLLHQFYDDRGWEFVKHTGKMFGMIFYSIACLGMPFIDGINYLKRTKYLKNDLLRNILLGIIVSVPLLLIITALLSEADLIFGEYTGKIFDFIFSADIFYIGIMIIFGFFACYCILCGALYKAGSQERSAFSKADSTIGVTIMVILCLIYVLFCGIQFAYLFTDGLFVLPSQFTFAEYARKGFFELLAVTIINIGIMILSNTIFRESKLLRLLVTFMTACTYIMIASATYRMLLYIGAYHLTFLRLFVLLTLLIDAFVLAGIIILQYKKNFPLFQYCILVISVCYIGFAFTKPDYYIASYLKDQNEMLTTEDVDYLTKELSLDAAPVVLSLINDSESWTGSAQDYYDRIIIAKKHNGIRNFNYSNDTAAKAAEKYVKQ